MANLVRRQIGTLNMAAMTIDQAMDVAAGHLRAGRSADAENLYRQIVAQVPRQVDALDQLGVIAAQAGRLDEAIAWFRRAVEANPTSARSFHFLGNACAGRRDFAQAAACYREVIRLQPDFAEEHYNLGNACAFLGQFDEAIACYRQAVTLAPGQWPFHNNLGNALWQRGRQEEAVGAYREVLRLRPDFAEGYANLGNALLALHRTDQAIESYREGLRLKPDPAAWKNLGAALQSAGRLDEAADCHRRAIAMSPGLADAHNALAGVLKDQGLMDEAIAAYRRAVELNPASAVFHSNLLVALNYDPATTRESFCIETGEWERRHAVAAAPAAHANARDPARRLRIGYVSADYCHHASAFFLLPLFRNHDPAQVEIVCYSNVESPDEKTVEFQRLVPLWRNIAGLADAQVAAMIRADQIDILVDLKLHTSRNRLPLFAQRAAPIQVSWLGYPGTTGLKSIDYRLTDPFLDPVDESEPHSAEAPHRLPETFWCYDPLGEAVEVNALPAIAAGKITFGCLNNFCKVNGLAVELWSRILQSIEGARLMILAPQGSHRQRLLERFQERGVEAGRIEFVAPGPRGQYLRYYHRMDISLDTMPYNGHTTSLDSLWMGVPVVTLAGNTGAGRAGASQLSNLGLPELIASSPDGYVRIATELARDPSRLAELRRGKGGRGAGLRGRMEKSPLMDAPRFTRHMEVAYRAMWQKWCAGNLLNKDGTEPCPR